MASSSRFVAILMGSDSDLPTMQATADVLTQFGIRYELNIKSAHRTPAAAQAYIADAERRGCAVFIAAAGLAAHLAGFIAGHTLRPVIGVPMDGRWPAPGHGRTAVDGADAGWYSGRLRRHRQGGREERRIPRRADIKS